MKKRGTFGLSISLVLPAVFAVAVWACYTPGFDAERIITGESVDVSPRLVELELRELPGGGYDVGMATLTLTLPMATGGITNIGWGISDGHRNVVDFAVPPPVFIPRYERSSEVRIVAIGPGETTVTATVYVDGSAILNEVRVRVAAP